VAGDERGLRGPVAGWKGGWAPAQDVAAELGIWPQTVGKWRRRFLDRRLEGLVDEPRPGARARLPTSRSRRCW
jgi:transposase-like protein